MNKDFDFISSKFREENINAPESLNENIISEKLSRERGTVKLNNKKGHSVKSIIALVACFAIFVGTVAAFALGKHTQPVVPAAAGINGITTFSNHDEIKALVKKNTNENGYGLVKNFVMEKSASVADAEIASDGATAAPSNSSSFAETNKQVDGVDEADIVKTDGKYIYYLCYDKIVIFSADNEKTKKFASIYLDDYNREYSEMFIYKDSLIALGTNYRERKGKEYYSTFANIYDIKDRSNPKLADEYSQSGSYESARMIGQYLYIISCYGGYYFNHRNCIPCWYDCDGKYSEIPVDNICAVDDSRNDRFAVIGAIDIETSKTSKEVKAILGVSENIYCNEKNIYLTGTNYDSAADKTTIIKYSLDKTRINLKASGSVRGTVNDQFSIDESDGKLRIATTSYNYTTGVDKNYLFVLDEKLNKIGDVSGFARDEHIEAVRFIGDMAYVITFQQTDPLFIIDLSDPKNPKITGEVKIDGFSTSLTPIDENTLLGIGHCTSENEYGGVYTDGVKIVLFDISDKNKPKVLDEKEYKNFDSNAQYSHKAIVKNPDKDYFAIPLNSGEKNEGGALIIRIKDKKLNAKKLKAGSYISRCTYIGDFLYAVEDEATEIYSFNV